MSNPTNRYIHLNLSIGVRSSLSETFCTHLSFGVSKLANSDIISLVEEENNSKKVVTRLYDAFCSNDTNAVHRFLAPVLEWWYHGPPSHRHHLIPLLTGYGGRPFMPLSITAFGSTVIAEGYDEERCVSWVHAWTVTDGVIAQVREYLNTSVTVMTKLGLESLDGERDASSSLPSTSSLSNIWQSKLCDESVPGLILAL